MDRVFGARAAAGTALLLLLLSLVFLPGCRSRTRFAPTTTPRVTPGVTPRVTPRVTPGVTPGVTTVPVAAKPAPVRRAARVPGTALKPSVADLSLGEIRARILDGANLTVAAEAYRRAEARGRVTQAALPPNPYVMLRKRRIDDFDLFGSGFGELEVGQPFELGGKRSARVAQARAEAVAVSEEVRVVTANLLRDAEIQFYRALRIAEDLGVAREEAQVASELEDLAGTRFREGKDSRIPVLRFEAAAADARLSVADLERRYERACRALDEFVGATPGSTRSVAGSWDEAALTNLDKTLTMSALERHPRRRAADRAACAADKAIRRADADRWTNLVVGIQGEYDSDFDRSYVGFTFLLPLPLWNKNEGERARARATARRAHINVRAEALKLEVELDRAILAYERALQNEAGYRNEILPRLQTSLDLAREAYTAGRATYLDVLDALLTLYRSRRTRFGHLEEQAQAAAVVRYLTEAF